MSSFLGSETQFFYALTPEIIDSALKQQHIRPVGRTLVLNSLENRVYSVEVQYDFSQEEEHYGMALSKDQVVVKFYRPGRWSAQAIAEEHQSLKFLKQREIAVVCPLEVEGKTYFTEEKTGLFFAVFPKVIGRLKDELREDEAEQLGRLIGRVHTSLSDLGAYRHRGEVSTHSFIDEHLVSLEKLELSSKHSKDSFLQLAKNLKPLIDQKLQGLHYQRIHGDIHRGNVMWTESGPFLMDFDDSLQGPVEQDLWLMIPGTEEYDQKLNQKFIEGYQRMQRNPVALHLNSAMVEALRTMRMIRFVGWIGKRYDDPFFQRMFPHFLTEGYWDQQVLGLKEQWSLLQG